MRGIKYNEGGFYRLVPIDRFMVVPGETVSLSGVASMVSAAFEKPLMTGGQFTVAAFYTPFRLLWDGWVDFVTQGDFGVTGNRNNAATGGTMSSSNAQVPTTAVNWPFLFEPLAATRDCHVFGRRAYKLIQNEFFGDKNIPRSVYTDPLDDADTSQKPTRNLDQWVSSLVMQDDVEAPTWNVPVSGANGTIDLDGFRQALVRARSMKRRDMSGDKYVDALMRMGVRLDWRVQQAPECLGVWKGELESPVTKVTADQGTGKMVSQFKSRVPFSTGKKFFAEHGIVWIVAVAKPHIFFPNSMAPDCMVVNKQAYFFGDNQVGTANIALSFIEPGAGRLVGKNFDYLLKGRSMAGQQSNLSWIPQATFDGQTQNADDILYPGGITDALQPQLDFGGIAFTCEFNHRVLVPFSDQII